ncbi:conserved hypothetical protein [Magnetococcus marinus MC-1]|uniref:YhaN AAA domain-containing protein n=1 Tax=Magnetococcus marinus (strain ATCC BAA-1437 / JCM 17883 / MC-1) TaxID=156889 RepID=A0LDI2_MAGMM|nr:YhaN family protein [Magnetococcus marinus]ABK46025.1 conserved hypothetical protein [Magnetococcus marinus MC-1]
MRINHLTLSRYGHFTDRHLPLGHPSNLTLLVGANEAGKSTTLHSILDLLFGIEPRSSYNFLHNYHDMRLEAELDHQGQRHLIKRHKGNKNTLRGANDQPLPEHLLTDMLAGMQRATYQNLFALNHEQLRLGGNKMTLAEGDLGELLFGASGALQGAGSIKTQLNKEVERWHGLNKRSGPMVDATNRLKTAQTELHAITVTDHQWQQCQAAFEQAKNHHQQVNQSYKTQLKQLAELQRLKQLIPHLLELQQLENQRTPLLHEPRLDANLQQQWQTLEGRWMTLQGELDRIHTLQHSTQQRLDELPAAVNWLHREQELTLLEESRTQVLGDQHRTPKLNQEIQQLDDQIRTLAIQLGKSPNSDWRTLQQQQPTTLQIQRLNEAMASHARWEQSYQQSHSQQLTIQQRVKALEAQQTTQALSPLHLEQLKTALAQLGNHAPLHHYNQCQERQVEQQKKLALSLAQLPCWNGDLTALQQLIIPAQSLLQSHTEQFQLLQKKEAQHQQHSEHLQQRMTQLQNQLHTLQQQGDLPTPERIQQLRQQRDTLWQQLLHHWSDTSPQQQHNYAALVQQADQLADARDHHGQQIHALQKAQTEVQHQQQLLHNHQQQGHALHQQQQQWWQQWRKLWPTSLHGLEPQAMQRWLEQRQTVLQNQCDLHALQTQFGIAQQQLAEACTTLRQTLHPWPQPGDDSAPFATLFGRVEATHSWAQKELAKQEAAQNHLLEAKQQMAQLQSQLQALQKAQEQWQKPWQATLTELQLSPLLQPSEVVNLLNQWQLLTQLLQQRSHMDHEAAAINQRETLFNEQADTLLSEVGWAPQHPEQRMQAVAVWKEAFTQARSVEKQRHAWQQELAEQQQRHQQLQADHADLAAQRAALLHHCQVGDASQMAERFERARQRRELDQQWQQKQQQVLAVAEGWSVDEAKAAVTDLDLEEIQQQIHHTEQSLADWQNRQEQANQALTAAAQRMEELKRGDPVQLAQALADAEAELTHVTRQWMAAFVAEQLFQTALEQFSLTNQGPVLKAARHHFSQLTNGRYPDLVIDYASGTNPTLMVKKRCGGTLIIDALSEGTKDQLYLALRLAAVEHHVDQLGYGLPFIADDLFVNFDDTRTMAGLQTLAQLSKKTQVLIFTHHPHLVALAQAQLGTQLHVVQLS